MKNMNADRINKKTIYDAFANQFITTLIGARRVGKTTLVKQFATELQQNGQWIDLNMDDLALKQKIATGNLRAHIEEQAKQKISTERKLWVAIDEAQKCPEIFDQIKIIYDNFKDQNAIKFILTGSGILNLHKLSAESLAGRTFIYNLRGFNLRETASLLHASLSTSTTSSPSSVPYESLFDLLFTESFNEQAKHGLMVEEISSYIDRLSPWNKYLFDTLQQKLIWGNFPEVFQLNNNSERWAYLASYLQTYLEKDIRDVGVISDLNLYQKIMEIVAQQTGSLKDDTRIVSTLGCSRDTLKKYRGFLSATLLYTEIYPYIYSALKRLVKSPKGYLIDNGLLSYLTSINDINILEKTGIIGARIENWFLNELQVALDRNIQHSNIYYWRTFSGAEVDFVVQCGTAIFPFEVTYTKKIDKKKVNNLLTFIREIKDKKITGFYIYGGEYKYDKENNMFFIPLWAI